MMHSSRTVLRFTLLHMVCGLFVAGFTSHVVSAEPQRHQPPARFTPEQQEEAVPMRPPRSALMRGPANPRPSLNARSRPAPARPGSRSMINPSGYHQPVEEVIETPAGRFAPGHGSETIYSDESYGEEYYEDGYGGDGYCADGSCGDGSCGWGCGGFCIPLCIPPLPCLRPENLQIFAGVNGFTGPANRGGTGTFGFFEGANWGNHFPFSESGWSYQIGAQATQGNFSGSDFTLDDRYQTFITGGLFRRVDCGLQGGVVIDYFHDEWYYQADLVQLRYELSWVYDGCSEVGFWGTSGMTDQMTTATFRTSAQGVTGTTTEDFQVTDIFAAFYRRQLAYGGEGRVWGGFTGQSDGIIGADIRTPITDCVDLSTSFTYLIPEQGINNNGVNEESWNISIGLVWYPGCMTRCNCPYDRPLFSVANNGNFLVDRTQR